MLRVYSLIAAWVLLGCTVEPAPGITPSLREPAAGRGGGAGTNAGVGVSAGMSAGSSTNASAGTEAGASAGQGASGMGSLPGAGSPAGQGAGAMPDASIVADAAPDAEIDPSGSTLQLTHTFEDIRVPARESRSVCQSWTLGNEEPLLVNRVYSFNGGGFQLASWVWVKEGTYAGPDGTWACADRGFVLPHQQGGAGGVFYGQSTQSWEDEQAFPEGVALELPARARVIGELHLVNELATDLTTRISFVIDAVPASAVSVKVQPMAFINGMLEVPSRTTSRARMQCGLPQADFDLYYVLPHFHGAGLAMHLGVIGGPLDGQRIWSSTGGYGQPMGATLSPPIAVTGAIGLEILCEYFNPTETLLRHGIDQEMCQALLFTNGQRATGLASAFASIENTGDGYETSSICLSQALP